MPSFNDVFLLLLGALAGVFFSYLWWWYQTHKLVPKISFSPEMAEYNLDSKNRLFLCKFQNSGKRDIVDLEVIVRIGIKEYMGASGWAFHTVVSNASRIPRLSQGKMRRVRCHDTRVPVKYIDEPSVSLKSAINNCKDLKCILNLGTDATVRVHVFGFDAFSGSRKEYASPKYRIGDIRKGTFEGLNVVENKRFSKPSVIKSF